MIFRYSKKSRYEISIVLDCLLVREIPKNFSIGLLQYSNISLQPEWVRKRSGSSYWDFGHLTSTIESPARRRRDIGKTVMCNTIHITILKKLAVSSRRASCALSTRWLLSFFYHSQWKCLDMRPHVQLSFRDTQCVFLGIFTEIPYQRSYCSSQSFPGYIAHRKLRNTIPIEGLHNIQNEEPYNLLWRWFGCSPRGSSILD